MVQRTRGASEVQVFDRMVERIRQMEKAHPQIRIREIVSNVEFIRSLHESSIYALIEGAVLACLVVFMIFRDWRATLIAAAAIPLSIVPTFAGMELLGLTSNMVTLIALALVTGVLVDDAIVEIESIIRHMRMNATGDRPSHSIDASYNFPRSIAVDASIRPSVIRKILGSVVALERTSDAEVEKAGDNGS